ncbi:conserved exported hypothetical protein [Candidatus Sulfopaludibacter sp. SbA4]|nr:conserved exported hypothetical protein [Candidatus Sulfopaludibacter sp. SbA4]
MKKNILRICTFALGLAGAQSMLPAQNTQTQTLEGVWDVSVTVTNCQTGALIRTVRSLQMFLQDGSFTESANTSLRGISVGTWNRVSGPMYNATYWFFRYNPDGTFASIAQSLDTITLTQDGSHFGAAGTIQDFDANNTLISTGCFVHQATRLVPPLRGN